MKNFRKRTNSTSSSLSSSGSDASRSDRHRSRSCGKKHNSGRSRSSSRDAKPARKDDYIGTNSKDPKMVASRIFVGNLPMNANLKKDGIEAIFKKYGKIKGLLLMNGYAFVQYDNEESAINAKQENGTWVKGNCIEVRVANEKKKGNNHNSCPLHNESYFHHHHLGCFGSNFPPPFAGRFPPQFYPLDPFHRPPSYPLPPSEFYRSATPTTGHKSISIPIDCEIILVNDTQRAYGEIVMKRLMAAGLSVELKALQFDSNTLTMVESARRKGILFAIIINEQNELHRSITVNILLGSPQEHRNMPLEDAFTLITRNFDKYVITKKERLASAASSSKVFAQPGQNVVYLLNLLADGRFLTLSELDVTLDYLVERRNSLAKSEGLPLRSETMVSPPSAAMGNWMPTGQIFSSDLEPRSPCNASQTNNAPCTSSQADKSCKGLAAVFENPLVQRALDDLLTSGPSLLKAVTSGKSHSSDRGYHQQQKFSSSSAGDPHPYLVHQTVSSDPAGRLHGRMNSFDERSFRDPSADMSWVGYDRN